MAASPIQFGVDGAPELSGEQVGEGATIVLLHGITATRRQVVHGSVSLTRAGYRLISFDARGHGASDPAPDGQGYTYDELAADLGRVVDQHSPGGPVVLVGHSMGCHTAANFTLTYPDRVSAVVLMGPVSRASRHPMTRSSAGTVWPPASRRVGSMALWRPTITA